MDVVWYLAKFALYTFLLVVIYRRSHTLLSATPLRQKFWVLFVGLLGLLNMGVASALGWNARLVVAVALFVLLLEVRAQWSVDRFKGEMREGMDALYKSIGMEHGRVLTRFGLASFGLGSLIGYFLFLGRA